LWQQGTAVGGELLAILADAEDQRIPSPSREGLLLIGATAETDRKLGSSTGNSRRRGVRMRRTGHLITAPGYGRSC